MVRPLEDIHQRGGTRIFMAIPVTIIATMATIIATTPTILATTIIATGIATKRNFEAASTGGLLLFGDWIIALPKSDDGSIAPADSQYLQQFGAPRRA
jgi:hypothetical protein